ncbi:MAG: Eco57I restriction-modification methylase domain-containing protein, partial [Acidimicrobiaceae bacterium]
MTQAPFQLQPHNPDVLMCIANLSNDEVFTPPELVNQMLDTLADSWAAANNGANIWADKEVTFLDPCTKSGVFLREITKRLVIGLDKRIPDLTERVNHIFTRQVFGIGITQLTSLLARRSLYCSKNAKGKYSIAREFGTSEGNIWFERTEHTWVNGKCKFCGANKGEYSRNSELETHAYAFIHSENVKQQLLEMFGDNMRFDVIIGNPPYQLSNGESSDIPIYQHFVSQAKTLEPKFLSMVIPARWMAGGKWLDDFRSEMLGDRRISHLVDYERMSEVFPGVDFEGGACYFLWDSGHIGDAQVTSIRDGRVSGPAMRKLDEFDVFVRDPVAARILRKVLQKNEKKIVEMVSGQTPFGLLTNFSDFHSKQTANDVGLHYSRPGSREFAYVRRSLVQKGQDLIDSWKVLVPKAFGERGAKPARVLGWSIVARPGEVCTQTYLVVGPFGIKSAAQSFESYYRTKLFRFLVSLRKITQDAGRATYSWVPEQTWDQEWTDEKLYKKYGIKSEEVAFIES